MHGTDDIKFTSQLSSKIHASAGDDICVKEGKNIEI
jgi:hypothetical protein